MTRPSHFPAGVVLALATALTLARCLIGCVNGKLTPAGAAAIEAGFAAACPVEAAIPVAGPALVAACPGEEALLAAALAAGTATSSPSTAAATQPLFRAAKPGEKPAATVRGVALAHAGWAAPGPNAAIVQAALLAPAPPSKPAPAPIDAGADR